MYDIKGLFKNLLNFPLPLSLFNLIILRISLIITYKAGTKTQTNQPVFVAKNACALPSCGILNATLPTILLNSTSTPSSTRLKSPFVL